MLPIISMALFILCLLAGLILVTLGYPGVWLIVADAFFFSVITDFKEGERDLLVLLVVLFVAVFVEVLELLGRFIQKKEYPASAGGIVCTLIGGLLGLIIGLYYFIQSVLIWFLLGAVLGGFVYGLIIKKKHREAVQIMLGSFFSRISILLLKTIFSVVLIVYVLMQAL